MVCPTLISSPSKIKGILDEPSKNVVLPYSCLVGVNIGQRGEKGRGVISDPRIVRHVAEKVRKIIGFSEPADLKVVDATFYKEKNPSSKTSNSSFHWARLERTGDNAVNDNDFCYDSNADGILDGSSQATLVNLDSIDKYNRKTEKIKLASSNEVTVSLPKFLRTKEEANGSDEYCDVLIGIPILKSHAFTGITGALKLSYGFRHYEGINGDTGRYGHNGLYIDENGYHNKESFLDYLCAQQIFRKYDLIVMDCLTGNRKGPLNPCGQIACNTEYNEPVDYILTNAVLASKDPVAIDTVAAVLGGYDPNSIELLEAGKVNSLGTNNPGCISVGQFTDFYNHRQFLYNQ